MLIDQEYEVVEIGRLQEHPQNPNRGDTEAIDESIDVNGWYGACLAQKSTGYILAGNHRYRVAVAKGAEKVPVIWRDVDDQTALRILLADNEIARHGEIDEEQLDLVLQSLETIEGTGYGLGVAEESKEPTGGAEEASEGDNDDVPDDEYTPTYGVMLVVGSEEQQARIYEQLRSLVEAGHYGLAGAKMRVVAV